MDVKREKQINILDWLNHNNPIEFQTISSFDEFINNFMISEEYIKKSPPVAYSMFIYIQ